MHAMYENRRPDADTGTVVTTGIYKYEKGGNTAVCHFPRAWGVSFRDCVFFYDFSVANQIPFQSRRGQGPAEPFPVSTLACHAPGGEWIAKNRFPRVYGLPTA